MKDIVIITTYMRPEYLQICLEHLAQATSTATPKEFWICADRRPDDEHRHKLELEWQKEVLDAWRGALPFKIVQGEKHSFNGNSFNVLESYKKAYNEPGVRDVYLVEDDVFVTPDFFVWHEASAQAEPEAPCSIAYRCNRNSEARRDVLQSGSYFTSYRDYASIGVRWKREMLEPVLEHARKEYYANQNGYISARFPGSRFAGNFTEQDGMIMRVMSEQKWFTVWPYVPRCYHMGWYGYHRPKGRRPDGFLEAKIDQIKATLRNADKLKFAAPDFGDIEAMPAEWPGPFEKLEKLQEFK
jgi:hypothetical protein